MRVGMAIVWHSFHEVNPTLSPDQDFIAFDEETGKSVGRVYLMHHSREAGRWRWAMFSDKTWGWPDFPIHGFEDRRGDAGRRVVEAYRLMIEHNARDPRRHGVS